MIEMEKHSNCRIAYKPSRTISKTFSSNVNTTSKEPSDVFSCHLCGAVLIDIFLLSMGRMPLRLYLDFC